MSFADLGDVTEADHSVEVFKQTRRSASYTVGSNPWAGIKPVVERPQDDTAAAPADAEAPPGPLRAGLPDPWLRLGRQLYVVLLVAVFFEYPAWAGVALGTFACFVIDTDLGPSAAAQNAVGGWMT